MLDCGLDFSPLLCFLPSHGIQKLHRLFQEQGATKAPQPVHSMGGQTFLECSSMAVRAPDFDVVDVSQVDVLLISNAFNMLALPFLTEYTDFRGIIYATEPTVQIGRHMMKELFLLLQEEQVALQRQTDISASTWQHSSLLDNLPESARKSFQGAWKWRPLYNLEELRRSVSKIQPVNFKETKSIFSLLKVTPVSAGFCLGGANWLIETSHEKVIYMADTSNVTPRHPEILDSGALGDSEVNGIRGEVPSEHPVHFTSPASVLILSETCANRHGDSLPERMIQLSLGMIESTINANGNVLIPTFSSGLIFDMFENIKTHLLSRMKAVPIFFISPVAEHSLAYANIIAEWLSKERQERVYLPEAPFPHEEMLTQHTLFHFNSADQLFASGHYQEPCIVFCGHPTLRCGAIERFISLWGSRATNTLLFLEPDVNYPRAVTPFQNLQMNIKPCPIDWRMRSEELCMLIKRIKCKQVIVPKHLQPNMKSLSEAQVMVRSYTSRETLDISMVRQYELGSISADLSRQIKPTVHGRMVCADFSGSLSTYNNQYSFDEPSLADLHTLKLHRQRYLYGQPESQSIIDKLRERGWEPSSLNTDEKAKTVVARYDSLGMTLTLSGDKTLVKGGNSSIQHVIAQLILEQCQDLSTKSQ